MKDQALEIAELNIGLEEEMNHVNRLIDENNELKEKLKIAEEYIKKMYESKYEPDKINIYYKQYQAKG